jgi:hypothetical protein
VKVNEYETGMAAFEGRKSEERGEVVLSGARNNCTGRNNLVITFLP